MIVTPLIAAMALAALLSAGAMGVFVYALHRRWFSRYENGFFLSLLLALMGGALAASLIVGAWGYEAAKRILEEEIVNELESVSTIVESQIKSNMSEIQSHLEGLADNLAAARADNETPAALRERLIEAQSFNSRYLQLRVIDEGGNVVLTTSEAGGTEPMNRVATAFNLEGKPFFSEPYHSDVFQRQVVLVSVPLIDTDKKIRGAVSARYDVAAELNALVLGSKFNQSGYAVVVDGEGEIIGHRDKTRLQADISSSEAVKLARQSKAVGQVLANNAEGEERLFVYRSIHNPATLAKNPWVLLTEIDPTEEVRPLTKLRRELAFGIGIVLLGSFLGARQVSRSITEPLRTLGAFAKRIGSGDLTTRTAIKGNDVAGRLSATLNEMANGLQERDHVKEVFGRYIATQVSDKILKGQVNLGGEVKRVTILFSDIRNFTGMSEAMAPQQVVAFLNDYFSEMVDAVFEQGGVLDKFIGDGLMAVFGSIDEGEHERNAVLAALRMKALLAKINGVRQMQGMPPIAIGIGIHTDEVIVGNIGSRKRLEYTVVGDGVNTSSRLQTLNKEFNTTILISETTYEAVKGDFECRQMPEAHLRGKTKNLQFYEVVSAKTRTPAVATV